MRVLVPASELGDEGSAAVAALRRRLGVRVPDVRSRVCSFWLKGTCKRGEACAFAHSDSNVNLAGTAAPCPPPIDGLDVLLKYYSTAPPCVPKSNPPCYPEKVCAWVHACMQV